MGDFLKKLGDRVDQSFRGAQGAVRGEQGDAIGFSDLNTYPSPSGSNVRQSSIANSRSALATRNMVRWMLPETGVIEMYVNPKSIKYSDSKQISETRTRGGYVVQYWGEELGKVSISGSTGSSGVEGINVLYDIYRNEQVSLDALALASAAARDAELQESNLLNQSGSFGEFAGDLVGAGANALFDAVDDVVSSGNIDPVRPKPTLASIAFQTELYWSGWVYRGFFKSMSVDEEADNLGMFNYTIEFVVTQKRGLRLNFMPWHRSAVNGPSNSDPAHGTPYSYSYLRNPVARKNTTNQELLSISRETRSANRKLKSYRPI